jgi:ABC-type multidrug transport system fused ATPase/permease subunit
MNSNSNNFTEKYIDFWLRVFNLKNKLKLIEVDFEKPWWNILLKQKWTLGTLIFVTTIDQSFWILFPLLVGKSIESGSVRNFMILISFSILILFILIPSKRMMPVLFNQSTWSLSYSTTRFLLTVDPAFHFNRSSGTIISKMQRGRDALWNILGICAWELGPEIVSLSTVCIGLLVINLQIGLVACLAILLISSLSVYLILWHTNVTRKYLIEIEDSARNKAVENLQQVFFIRSNFATKEQLKRQYIDTLKAVNQGTGAWLGFETTFAFTNIIYNLSVLAIGLLIFQKIQINQLAVTTGISMMATYFLGTSNILQLGEKVRRFSENRADIIDMFEFLRNFGKQTYPVLEGEVPPNL